MTITDFTPVPALIGGLMLGTAAAWVLLWNGRIAGISGVVARIFSGERSEAAWRVAFVLGMIGGGALCFAFVPAAAGYETDARMGTLVGAGLMVGFGTRISGGCTSGHGVCGIGRGSRTSIVATLVFIATGAAVVFVLRHVVGGAS